jgi:phospho-N-acetylmuramoyl-pentapeptide-transferase
MERVLAAAILAMAISILAGPKLIAFLRRKEFGQHIREEGPAGHAVKQGTPTMGGVLFVLSAVVPFVILSRYTIEGLTVFFVTLACAAIGFIDDYIKVRHRRSLGLAGRWKLLMLAAITAAVAWVVQDERIPKSVYVPVIDWKIGLSLGFFVLLFLIIAGAANGANLTDGIDGLAIGVGIIALFTFTAISMLAYFREGQIEDVAQRVGRDPAQDLAIWGAALIGGAIGFLWYNAFPAEVIMGDTGSMAIGGALGAFAVMTKAELLLLLAGGIFVVEAVSVILQVFSFRYWGRRLFLMAPIHHHFEMKAWSETKIMVRFWILAGILCATAFALYYQYYFAGFRDLR